MLYMLGSILYCETICPMLARNRVMGISSWSHCRDPEMAADIGIFMAGKLSRQS